MTKTKDGSHYLWEVYSSTSHTVIVFLTEAAARKQTIIGDVDYIRESRVYLPGKDLDLLVQQGYLYI